MAALLVAVLLPALLSGAAPSQELALGGRAGTYVVPAGIHKIRHVIIIMQENRSFDSYFGTYPGADGYPRRSGRIAVCVPDPATNHCVTPYHDTADINGGAPHGHVNAVADIHRGRMDGFIREQREAPRCADQVNPACVLAASAQPDVMGYHDQREIPNYWTYAHDFVLDDHMFEPVSSWSEPDHLYMVSGWSARCANASPSSCVNNIIGPYGVTRFNRAVSDE
ncbi:MAG TPA: alkaline phosphatase family protein, partial [Acidimicrobiales bacterium]|nr:alkaline phosphatase family protein [Acidimicrobiales bacterium]